MRIVRRIFWSVLVLLILAASLGNKTGSEDLTVMSVVAVIGWWFTGGFFSRLIGVMLVSSLKCKSCGLEIPAVGQWRVGSYTDHRERHILAAKNPIDGGRVGHFDCPQCSATILV